MDKQQEGSRERWTPAQSDAITVRDCRLLVSAAAGAGKTAVLVERIVRRLLDPDQPLDIERILVVTFTEAAAAEMRQRIGAGLLQALDREPGNKHIERQVALLGRAAVSTLHSFCLRVIRERFFLLDLDPAFRVANEAETSLLRLEVIEDLFERRYAAEPDGGGFTGLVERCGGMLGDEALRELVLQIYDFTRSLPLPAVWLSDAVERFHLPDGSQLAGLPWTQAVQEMGAFRLDQAEDALVRALALAVRPDGPQQYHALLEQDLAMVRDLRGCLKVGRWDEELWRQAASGFSKLPPIKAGQAVEELKKETQALRDEVKKTVRELAEKYFARPERELVDELRLTGDRMRDLVDLVREFEEAYLSAKRTRALVDFADLEHFCLRLLAEPAIDGTMTATSLARELQARFDEVLVDEYQDINEVQEAILALLSRQDAGAAPNLFMVGDVKQCIYRFRNAEPRLFLEKYARYPGAAGGSERRIDLAQNFRSRTEVIDAVNFLFRQLLTPGVAGMVYDGEAEMRYGAAYPEAAADESVPPPAAGPVEVHLIERQARGGGAGGSVGAAEGTTAETGAVAGAEAGIQEDAGLDTEGPPDQKGTGKAAAEAESLEELEALEQEGLVIARRIQEMVRGREFRVWDRSIAGYRPVAYRDIVILMRATRARANVLLEIFRQHEVPAYAELGTGYFAATEVENILALLRVIDNPRQDIFLAAILRSPIVGLTAAELAHIRLCADGDFYSAVLAARQRGPGDLAARLDDFLERLEVWRTYARRAPVGDLLWRLYRETGYLDYVGGMPGGEQRRANLRALLERARQFEGFSRRGLFGFLRFVELLRENDGDMGIAGALGENEDVVRIISIHKSKGLEFPVVFVADLGKRFNLRDFSGDVLLHPELGLGPMLVDPLSRIRYPTLAHSAIRQRCLREGLAEELRVLYVALTRARERLVLVGSTRDAAGRCAKWCRTVAHQGWTLPDAQLAEARTCLDWVGLALIRHSGAAALRSMGGGVSEPVDLPARDDRSVWRVQVWGGSCGRLLDGKLLTGSPQDRPAMVDAAQERIRRLAPLDLPDNPELMAEIERRLTWVSPTQSVSGRAAKVAVSEIKRRFDIETEAEEPRSALIETASAPSARINRFTTRPVFLQAEHGLSAVERGTASHLVLQHLDLGGALDDEGIMGQISGMVARELLTPEQAAAVAAADLARFFREPLGSRLVAGRERVRREVAFSLGLPAAEVYPDLPPGEAGKDRVLVQGIIDCLLDVGDGFLLIDFKTDRMSRQALTESAARYRPQVALYAHAVRAIYRRSVREAYLYFLTSGTAIKVTVS